MWDSKSSLSNTSFNLYRGLLFDLEGCLFLVLLYISKTDLLPTVGSLPRCYGETYFS